MNTWKNYIRRNILMEKLGGLPGGRRAVILAAAVLFSVLLTVSEKLRSTPLSSPVLLASMIGAAWICVNAVLYVLISFRETWEIGKRSLAANLVTALSFLLFLVILWSNLAQPGAAGQGRGFIVSSLPPDRSCTVSVCEIEENPIEGYNANVYLQMAEEEEPKLVCRLVGQASVEIVWKDSARFSVGDQTYLIQNGAAEPEDVS